MAQRCNLRDTVPVTVTRGLRGAVRHTPLPVQGTTTVLYRGSTAGQQCLIPVPEVVRMLERLDLVAQVRAVGVELLDVERGVPFERQLRSAPGSLAWEGAAY